MVGRAEVPINVLLQYFRVPVGDVPVDYAERPVLLGSRITNVSTTGVFVRTPKPLAKGSPLHIAFFLPGSTVKIEADTVVRWTTFGEQVDDVKVPAGMGLEFANISTAHRKQVSRFVAAFLERMRKT